MSESRMAKLGREYDERLAAQTEALAALGFGPAVDVGDGMFNRPQVATCQTCGAAVLTDAVGIHHAWHDTADLRQAP